MWIDTHCHLANSRFDEDLCAVIERAQAAGVEKIVVPATDLFTARRALDYAERHSALHVAVGVHPCDVDGLNGDEWIGELAALCLHPKVAAVGEIGLDFFHPPPLGWSAKSWQEWQERCLRLQLDMARAQRLPVVLHQRQSMVELRRVLDDYRGQVNGVFHCFTGDLDEALALLDLGHLVSFTGLITFPMRWRGSEVEGGFELPAFMNDPSAPLPTGAAALAAVDPLRAVAKLPARSFMLETDAPYLAPNPARGRRCEPRHLTHTAAAAALVRGCSPQQLARETSDCARSFFRGL